MTPCHVPVCPAHPAVQVTRTRRGVEEQVSYVNFGSPPPSPRLPCRHCHMTFVNEQGLGIHVKTMHSTANMYKGMRLRRMLGKGDGGRILPWEHAGPGHCWRVTFDHTTGGGFVRSSAEAVQRCRLRKRWIHGRGQGNSWRYQAQPVYLQVQSARCQPAAHPGGTTGRALGVRTRHTPAVLGDSSQD